MTKLWYFSVGVFFQCLVKVLVKLFIVSKLAELLFYELLFVVLTTNFMILLSQKIICYRQFWTPESEQLVLWDKIPFSSPWLISHSVVFMETWHDWLLCPVIAHLILSGVAFIVTLYTALPLRLKRVATLDDSFKWQRMFLFCLFSFLLHAVTVSLMWKFLYVGPYYIDSFLAYITAYVLLFSVLSSVSIVLPFNIWKEIEGSCFFFGAICAGKYSRMTPRCMVILLVQYQTLLFSSNRWMRFLVISSTVKDKGHLPWLFWISAHLIIALLHIDAKSLST